jgi:hypothetical protein
MLLTRHLAQRRFMLLGLAGALVLCTFFVMPQGQVLASALLVLFRGQTIQPIATDYAHLQNAYRTLEELEKLGSLQGTVPTQLTSVASINAAGTLAHLTLAEPSTFPANVSHTPASIKALAPTTVTLTLSSATANAYFKSIGSNQTLPAQYEGEQLIVNFPGVVLMEYTGSARLYVGEAGQLWVQVAGNATDTQLYNYLLGLPGLSSDTVSALKGISSWQTTIPLGIPTDRAGWIQTTVGGAYGGPAVVIDDKTGLGSAVVWRPSNGTQTLGVGGPGLTTADVQAVAGSLH